MHGPLNVKLIFDVRKIYCVFILTGYWMASWTLCVHHRKYFITSLCIAGFQ